MKAPPATRFSSTVCRISTEQVSGLATRWQPFQLMPQASEAHLTLSARHSRCAGDVVHILHVIAPSRRLVVTPDMGLEGVIEDDEETKRKVVS